MSILGVIGKRWNVPYGQYQESAAFKITFASVSPTKHPRAAVISQWRPRAESPFSALFREDCMNLEAAVDRCETREKCCGIESYDSFRLHLVGEGAGV